MAADGPQVRQTPFRPEVGSLGGPWSSGRTARLASMHEGHASTTYAAARSTRCTARPPPNVPVCPTGGREWGGALLRPRTVPRTVPWRARPWVSRTRPRARCVRAMSTVVRVWFCATAISAGVEVNVHAVCVPVRVTHSSRDLVLRRPRRSHTRVATDTVRLSSHVPDERVVSRVSGLTDASLACRTRS